MSKRLWVVQVTADVVVLAENEAEAVYAAREAERSGEVDPEPASAVEMSWLPDGWDLDCLPFGGNDDEQTLGKLIEAGAAPRYTAARAERERLLAAKAGAK